MTNFDLSKYPHPVYAMPDGFETGESSGDTESFDARRELIGLSTQPAVVKHADVVSSQIVGESDMHSIMLDLDVPAHLVPSSTPGHSHLYIDVKVPWHTYLRLLSALADAGVIERGYVGASKKRGGTFLRLPWVKKKKGGDLL